MATTSPKSPHKKEEKSLLQEAWEKDSKLVKGVFRNLETPGMALKFSFRKYPQDRLTKYLLEDGKEYDLPVAVVKHLNSGCSYMVHKYAQDSAGKILPMVGKRVSRYQFQPSSYLEASGE